MKHLYFFSLFLILTSCNSPETSDLPTSEIDESTICDCIQTTNSTKNPDTEINALMDCILSETNNDKDRYFEVLISTMQNCEGFSKRISELNLTKAKCDTIQFSTPIPDDCQNNFLGKWKDVLSPDSDYSINYEDRVEHFEAGVFVGKWEIISREDCQVTYLVTEQAKTNQFPPNIGDTVITTTIGITDSFVKNVLQIDGIELFTVGEKLGE